MKEWKVILATLVIFAAGVITGGLLVNHSVKSRQKPAGTHVKQPPQNRGPIHETRFQYIRVIEQQLELTTEQREKIDLVINDSQMRVKGYWDAAQPKINEEMKRVKEQIREHLTPDQRKKFDELNKQRAPKKEQRKDPSSQRTNARPAVVSTNSPVAVPK